MALLAFIVLLLLMNRDDPAQTGDPTEPTGQSRPTSGPSSGPETSDPTGPDQSPSTEPSADPTGPTSSPSTGPEGDGPSGNSGNPALVGNPLYDAAMPTTDCADVVAAAPTTAAEMESVGNAHLECLDAAWSLVVSDSGFSWANPTLTVFEGSEVTTACGTAGGAFYCSADEGIYISATDMPPYITALEQSGLAVSYFYITTHEYHHHVQNRAGIIEAMLYEYQPDQLQGMRRLELQDQCWVSMAFRNTAGLDFTEEQQQLWLGILQVSTSPQHGDSTSTVRWGTVGLTAETLAECSTWTAPADQVT